MRRELLEAEVIVIGGGAAGCSAAVNLARQGRQVVLLEGRQPGPPRLSEVHSGEVLSPGAQQELDRLGFAPASEAPDSSYLERWRLQSWDRMENIWPGGQRTLDRLPHGWQYWQINRGGFYRELQKLAVAEGVLVRQGVRVTGLLQNQAGAYGGVAARSEQGSFELKAPVIVEAGGRNSVVMARLSLRQPEPEFGRAAYLFFFSGLEGRPPPPGVWQSFWLNQTTTLRGSLLAPNLYRFSLETSLAERQRWLDRFGRLAPFDLFLMALAEQLPREAHRFARSERLPHTLAFAPIGYRVRQITFDGLLLIGDAAGYLDTASGQGLEFALRMGRLAASSINRAFERNRFDQPAFADYLAGWHSEVAPIMSRLRWFLRLSQQPWALNSAGYLPPLRRAIISQMVRPRPATFKEPF